MFETLSEIAAVISILIKFDRDDILDNKDLFIAFLNELGIRIDGTRKINASNLRTLSEDITVRQKRQLIEEFNLGHEPVYRRLAMYTNSSKY